MNARLAPLHARYRPKPSLGRIAERAFRVNRTAAGAFNEAAQELGFEACAVGEIHPGR